MSARLGARISGRVLALVGLVTFAIVLATVNGVVVQRAQRQLTPVANSPPHRVERALEQCDADPGTWRSTRVGRVRFDAFDGTSFASSDPLGGELDRALLARLNVARSSPVRVGFVWGLGSRVVWRRGPGPCGLVQAEVVPSANLSLWLITTLAAAGSAAGLALLLAWGLVVRPLGARVRRLRSIAERLDQETGARPVAGHDDLETIAQALEHGIEKHAEANALLVRRSERLERHLEELAHDLRTPLAALQLALERSLADVPTAERKALLARALAEHVYMTTLLANLEAATTIEGELPSLLAESEVELGMLLETVVARFALLAEQRGIQLSLGRPDAPVVLRAAPTLLERGVSNLVHNAVRHGHAGGHVAVLLVQDPEGFTLSIEDDGPGMPDSLLASLSDPHGATLRGTARADGSRGLGLRVVSAAFQRAGLGLSFQRGGEGGLLVTVTTPAGWIDTDRFRPEVQGE